MQKNKEQWRKKVGNWGEKAAEEFLAGKGYEIVERNFLVREGEIDLVCKDGEWLVFVEVKARVASSLGAPEENVGKGKFEKLARAIERYLEKHGLEEADFRLDIVGVERDRVSGKVVVRHYRDVL